MGMKSNRFITIILVALLAVFVLSALATRYAEPVNDGDIWFHLSYGRYLLENHTVIPDHTVFSWTPTQNKTIYCTWLSDIVFFLLFKAGGLNMLYAFRYLVIVIFIALALTFSRGSPMVFQPLIMLICLVGLMMSYTGLRIRSDIFSFLFMSVMVWIWLSTKLRKSYSHRLPYLLPIVTLLWVNSHGGFIFGMCFLALVLAGEWINRISGSSERLDDRTWKSLLVSVILSAFTLFINPYGWSYLSQLLNDLVLNPDELRMHMQTIQEYWSVFNRSMSAFHFIDWLVVALAVLITLFAVQARQKRTDWSLLLVNILFMLLYVKFLRTTYFWGIIFTFSSIYLLRETLQEGVLLPLREPVKAAAQGLCVVLLLFMATRAVYDNFCSPNIGFNLKYVTPMSEAEYIGCHLRGLRMGNDYLSGSYLIWSLYPSRKVFIDERYFPYKKWYQEYNAFEQNIDSGNTAAFLKKYPCDFWCISYSFPVMSYFVSSPEWKPVYYGPAACIFVSAGLDTSLLKPSTSESTYRSNLYNAYDIAKSAATTGDIDIARKLAEGINPCLLCRRQKETAINAKLNVGNFLVGGGKYYEAIRVYSGALLLDSSNALSGWLFGKGKDSDIAKLHDNLGYALLNSNQPGDALREFDLALKLKPDAANAGRYLPLLRNEIAKIDASISRLKAALASRPDDMNLLQSLAVQYTMKGQYDEALQYLRKELSIKPDNPEIYYNIACIYSKQNNVKMSLSYLDQAVQKGFHNWSLLGSDHDLDNVRTDPSFQKLMGGH
jgi:tetratricopeptide (TPR) repeat protein